MASYKKKAFTAVAVLASASVVLTGCGGGSGSNSSSSSSSSSTKATKGGTLTYYIQDALDHTDPQREYLGRDLSNLNRTVYRSLVSFPASTNITTSTTPVADLATNTGTSSQGGKVWSFTIKDGVKWQDGKPITCEDFKYGASRVFATDVITGGPNYLLSYLNIPTGKDGLPTYKGPYTTKNNDVASFNKAITCQGQTITYHFKQPWPDFPEAVASLGMMDPYRKDKDQGDKSNFQIFSDGPYEVQGSVDANKGYTLVRNPNYDPKTDNPAIRQANPDKIIYNVGKTSEQIADQLIADSGTDQAAVTGQSIPPSYYTQIVGDVAKRAVNIPSPFVDYLVLNFARLKNPAIRQAIAAATDDEGWINAGGGTKSYDPASSIVNPTVKGYQANPAYKRPSSGDVDAAKQILAKAGVKTPVSLTFTYPSTPTADKQAAALTNTWKKAGLNVKLDGVANSSAYYTNIQQPSQKADIIWAGWGADWPSAITVTAPLFDSRPNLRSNTNGQDYGRYQSDVFNKYITQAQNAADIDTQTKALQQADLQLGKDVAYIPLEIQKFYMLRGSKVTGYQTDAASAMYPDLGPIGVQ